MRRGRHSLSRSFVPAWVLAPFLVPSTLSSVRSEDCNANGILDGVDIERGTSADCDANRIPDECDIRPDFRPVGNLSFLGGYFGSGAVLATGDLDGDGADEVVHEWPGGLAVRFGDGTGRSRSVSVYPLPLDVTAVAIIDLDGDGRRDVLAAARGENAADGRAVVATLRNKGEGSLDWIQSSPYEAPSKCPHS